MLEKGISPSETSVRNLVGGGEPALSLPFSRQRLAEIWNAKPWKHFGCTESPRGICGSCIKHGQDILSVEPSSIHVWEDMGICELVDDNNDPVPVGTQGYFVWTDLYSEAGPLLRFKPGDIAVFTEEKCGCGRTSIRAIGGFRGRPGDVNQIGGTSFIVSDFESVIKKFDEIGEEYRLLITKEKGLSKLKVICEARAEVPITSYPKIAEELKKAIKISYNITASIEIVGSNTLGRQEFKAKRLIDLRAC
jgi:phenylacetate-CoA ligase